VPRRQLPRRRPGRARGRLPGLPVVPRGPGGLPARGGGGVRRPRGLPLPRMRPRVAPVPRAGAGAPPRPGSCAM
ncbi:MAG: hypothetical protein AVDCRST_MAG13-3874, partial [uncultured Solirubrobacteraceae bacterium]